METANAKLPAGWISKWLVWHGLELLLVYLLRSSMSSSSRFSALSMAISGKPGDLNRNRTSMTLQHLFVSSCSCAVNIIFENGGEKFRQIYVV